jgi:hypothetical protein
MLLSELAQAKLFLENEKWRATRKDFVSLQESPESPQVFGTATDEDFVPKHAAHERRAKDGN